MLQSLKKYIVYPTVILAGLAGAVDTEGFVNNYESGEAHAAIICEATLEGCTKGTYTLEDCVRTAQDFQGDAILAWKEAFE